MRYHALKAEGVAIGSGVVEAANKTLVTQRMKRSGMRWRIASGQAVLTFRALIKSGRFDRHGRPSSAQPTHRPTTTSIPVPSSPSLPELNERSPCYQCHTRLALRQGKSWRGGRHRKEVAHPETFHRELAGSTPARQRRSPSAGSECCMARGNARREAYTAGGKAPLMSLEILNDDAFIVVSVGAAPEAPPTARRHGSSGVEERRHSHGIARQETWETRHRPCGREPVGGATGMVTKPRPDARTCGASGARGATPRTAQAHMVPDGEPISPRDAVSGVVAPP